jgi:hypothetical protein
MAPTILAESERRTVALQHNNLTNYRTNRFNVLYDCDSVLTNYKMMEVAICPFRSPGDAVVQ